MRTGNLVIAAAIVLAAACSSGSPEQKILEQRARFSVDLLSWAQGADGAITIGTRVSGPPNSSLEKLTVRIVLQDAEGRTVDRRWHTFDLSEVPRGGPSDLLIRIAAPPTGEVEGIGIDPVFDPGPDDRDHIVELRN